MRSSCTRSDSLFCAACLDGTRGECHAPGCAFWMTSPGPFNIIEIEEPLRVAPASDPNYQEESNDG